MTTGLWSNVKKTVVRDSDQIRKVHSLGFPSGEEIGFAEVVEVSEVVDHDAVTVNFDVGRLGHLRLPAARIGRGDRELPDGHERNYDDDPKQRGRTQPEENR